MRGHAELWLSVAGAVFVDAALAAPGAGIVLFWSALALYNRIESAEGAAAGGRLAILDEVRRVPGIHLRELQRRTGFAWGKLTYHVGVLKRERAVRLERRAKHVHVYLAEAGAEDPVEAMLAVRGAAAGVYRSLPDARGVTQRDLEARLGLSHQLVSYHLRWLERAGLVSVLPGRPKRYLRARGTLTGSPERAT